VSNLAVFEAGELCAFPDLRVGLDQNPVLVS
jgi:hypothetical protein